MSGHIREQFGFRSVLAVCAHPDDESFGLGAVISTFGELGIETSLLCFTHGEASTLGTNTDDLARRRADELEAATAGLGIRELHLLSYPDGHLWTSASPSSPPRSKLPRPQVQSTACWCSTRAVSLATPITNAPPSRAGSRSAPRPSRSSHGHCPQP